ncbi:TRAP transporter small permease [Tamlana fucoidanivorans]|uniref:TRAP transporter small permease n=1 Tax=Allotamlana fucoidanivorans TaxID=2583814 RepID=UPI00130518AE|nr:TRAP transporter small permease subunit [Tamlana fucoidanivorans]
MNKIVGKLLKTGTLLAITLLIATVLLQIFARFFLSSAPPWTEEVSRLFFIYAVTFAAALAFKSNYFIYVDMLYNKVNNTVKRILNLIVYLVTLLLFMVLSVTAIGFVKMGIAEQSPSLGVNMGIAFSSIFLLAVFMCYYLVQKLMKFK